jgi:hypothetical protein
MQATIHANPPPRGPRRRRWRRIALAAGLAVLLVAGIGFLVLRDEILPESSPTSRGMGLAREAGCFACHGERPGSGAPRIALGPPPPAVPGILDGEHSPQELREWIADGVSAARRASRAWQASRARARRHMPA